jgi:two-component system phosphate regulon response regulator PhoB
MHPVVMLKGIYMQLHTNQTQSTRSNYWGRYESNLPVSLGALHITPVSNLAQVGDVAVFLRPMEFRLLHFFMTHPNKVHTREQLLEKVWGDWIVVGVRTVDVHIRRVRATLQPFGLSNVIKTVHCRGYLFTNEATATSIN